TGLHQTPDDIVNTVIQEDPDAVLLSILSGAHNAICPVIMQKLKEKGIDDVLVAVGGIIPDEDKPFLEKCGLKGFHGPGTKLKDIVEFVKNNLKR
ncbi:MAG: cobalamin B12-binding domain-containing protein, partial [Promethearchaeota archaeon]